MKPRYIARESRLHTDEGRLYGDAASLFVSHETVHHSSGEYAHGDVHTNTAEGYFGVFKKGMRGVYQDCAEKHLHWYLAEYDFRFNHRTALGATDGERTEATMRNASGKRLATNSLTALVYKQSAAVSCAGFGKSGNRLGRRFAGFGFGSALALASLVGALVRYILHLRTGLVRGPAKGRLETLLRLGSGIILT